MRRPSVTFELENPLCDGRDDGVMPSLDIGKQAGEAVVVVVHFRRPRNRLVRLRIVTAKGRERESVHIAAHDGFVSERRHNDTVTRYLPMQRDLLPALL